MLVATRAEFSLTPHEDDERLRLDGWRRNVGTPVALDLASTEPGVGAGTRSLVVLSWNVWIGRGRVREVVTRIRNGDFQQHGADPDVPLVILAQEAYRSDSSVPAV